MASINCMLLLLKKENVKYIWKDLEYKQSWKYQVPMSLLSDDLSKLLATNASELTDRERCQGLVLKSFSHKLFKYWK